MEQNTKLPVHPKKKKKKVPIAFPFIIWEVLLNLIALDIFILNLSCFVRCLLGV